MQWVQANGQPPPGCGNACLNPDAFGASKAVALVQAVEGGTYFARVFGPGGAVAASYDLEIRYVVGQACLADETFEVGYPSVAQEVHACPGARHQYCFDHAGGGLSARAGVDQGGDVALRFRDAAGGVLAQVDDEVVGDECLFQAVDAGRYCVEVDAIFESTYDLVIDDVDCD